MPHWTPAEFLLVVLVGAFGPFRSMDRWYWRMPWWRKALWHFALTALAVFGASIADRLARSPTRTPPGP